MTTCRYCTPEWLEETVNCYHSSEQPPRGPEKLNTSIAFRVKAEPAWGIERDILFGAVMAKGALEKLGFLAEQDALARYEFIVSATPQEWKKILRRESKFLTDFMLGKIILEHGSKVAMIGLAPYSNVLVDGLTLVDLQFPDEMTPDELQAYRAHQEHFRSELHV